MLFRTVILIALLAGGAVVVRQLSAPRPSGGNRSSTSAQRSSSTTQTAEPRWPIEYRVEVQTDPPRRIYVATIDLSDPRVHVRVRPGGDDPDGPDGPWQTTLQRVSEIAARDHLDVAINGNFFAGKDSRSIAGRRLPYFIGNWAKAVGFAVSDGWRWGEVPSYGADGPSLIIDSNGRASIEQFKALPADVQQCVTGSDWIVKDGKAVGRTPDVAPRTAVGMDRAGKTMFLVVIDGRRADYSVGMSGPQLSEYMATLGCWRAIMLDGGGSSTMVCRESFPDGDLQLKNRPSDGHDLPISLSFERAVDNALGVSVDR